MRLSSRVYGVCVLGLALMAGPSAVADMTGHGGMVRALCVSPDGATVASGGFDYTLRTWTLEDQQPQGIHDGHDAPLAAVVCLDGGRVVSGDAGGVLRFWQLNGETVEFAAREAHAGRITALAAPADGRWVASAGWEGEVILWSPDGERLRELPHVQPVMAVAFTDDGASLWTAVQDGTLRRYTLPDGAEAAHRPGHGFAITAMAMAPGGTGLLTAGIDGTARLRDPHSGEERLRLEQHDGPVLQIAAEPDGEAAVTVGRDGMMLRWSLRDGTLMKATYVARGPVWSLALSPDGSTALTGDGDGVIGVWAVDLGRRLGPEAGPSDEPRPWLTSDHPGADLFLKCAACHSLREDGGGRSGPHFKGLLGRPAGAVEGYRYSEALKGSGVVWDRQALADLFRDGPDAFVPGTRMPLQRIPDDGDLADLVDYLALLSEM